MVKKMGTNKKFVPLYKEPSSAEATEGQEVEEPIVEEKVEEVVAEEAPVVEEKTEEVKTEAPAEEVKVEDSAEQNNVPTDVQPETEIKQTEEVKEGEGK